MNPVPVLNSRVYDALKYLAQIVLPGAGTAYFALAGLWNLPNANQVVGTLVIIDTFLGALLNLSSKAYESSGAKYAGSINVEETDATKSYSLSLDDHPDVLDGKDEVTFKVNKGSPPAAKPKRRKTVSTKPF
jgi:hypothetical protein